GDVIPLGLPAFSTTGVFSVANAVNEAGDVAGSFRYTPSGVATQRAVVWVNGVGQILPDPFGSSTRTSQGLDINADRWPAGDLTVTSGVNQAAVWRRVSGTTYAYHDIHQALSSIVSVQRSSTLAINDNGQAVGYVVFAAGSQLRQQGFLWSYNNGSPTVRLLD